MLALLRIFGKAEEHALFFWDIKPPATLDRPKRAIRTEHILVTGQLRSMHINMYAADTAPLHLV